jgi:hypothetical protein
MSLNPFLDLGFSHEEAAALHIRSQLAATLEHYTTRKEWNQAEAARGSMTLGDRPEIRKFRTSYPGTNRMPTRLLDRNRRLSTPGLISCQRL